jgi:uncharacterized protein
MQYRTMKKTGDRLSVLGFGCMRVPQKRGRIDEARATRQIRFAIDQGVNYVDTAMLYHMGANEPFVGRALADGYREKVKLATKPLLSAIKSREDMGRVLNAQLGMLRTDYIDYYLFHGLNGQVWKRMRELGGRDFLDKAKADGRIRFAGFSFHGDIGAFKEIVDDYDWDACLIQYSYLDENNQAGTEGLEYAAAKGLGVVIMEPLRGGNLTGRIPPAVQAIWDEAEVKRSPAEWALRWVWNHPEVTVVLSGMNREDHIRENLRIADEAHPHSLSKRELELVNRVAETYRGLMKAGCTGCRYCMPCPSGVDIPSCFEIHNGAHIFGDKQVARVMYLLRQGGLGDFGESSLASRCVECGECEEKCPQGLPVSELLKDVAGDFEGRGTQAILRFLSLFFTFQGWVTMRKARKAEKRAREK